MTAEAYAGLEPDAWRAFGLSRVKAETLSRVADAVVDGDLDLQASERREPGKGAIRELTAIKGIGRWTAEVYLMFCAGHADVFPVGDVALQAAVGMHLGWRSGPLPKALARDAAVWAPWRIVAARLFWAYYAVKMRRDALPVDLIGESRKFAAMPESFWTSQSCNNRPNIEGADAESIRRVRLTIAVSPQALPALVLNADYRPLSYYPLSLWSWQDAIKAVFLDRVNIIAEYDHPVSSPSFSMRLPSVVCLKSLRSALPPSGLHPVQRLPARPVRMPVLRLAMTI